MRYDVDYMNKHVKAVLRVLIWPFYKFYKWAEEPRKRTDGAIERDEWMQREGEYQIITNSVGSDND